MTKSKTTMKKIISTLTIVTTIFLLTNCKKDCIKSDRCNLEPEVGGCYAYIPRYYFDKKDKKCKEFIWGGCDGVVPFKILEECQKQCDCK